MDEQERQYGAQAGKGVLLVRLTGTGSVGTMTDNPVENGVAIGANATVTGDNGIAIGYKVTAGENEIIIGGTATTRTVIGGIDLEGISGIDDQPLLVFMTNAANISETTARETVLMRTLPSVSVSTRM